MSISRNDYFKKLFLYMPTIRSAVGPCYGHSQMGMQALLALDRDTFARRLNFISSGLPKPGHPEEKLHVKDFDELLKKLKLENAAQAIIAHNLQVKRELENTKVDHDAQISGPTLMERFIDLVKDLGQDEFIPWMQPKDSPSNSVKTDYISDEELSNQIALAGLIRQTFTQQTYARIKSTLETELKGSDTKDIFKQINAKVAAELEQFDRENPFISDLVEMDIFIQDLTLYQAPQSFHFLKELPPSNFGSAKATIQLIAPVNLDDKIENLARFSRCLSLNKLQIYFDSLAKEIRSYYLAHYSSDDPKLKTDLPLALNLASDTHAITVGYNVSKAKWILLDSNQLPFREVSDKDIARVVMKALLCKDSIIINSPYSSATLFFDVQSGWVLMDSYDNAPQNPDPKTFYKLIQVLIASPKLKHLESLNLNIETFVYINKTQMSEIDPIITSWMQSKAFQDICTITAENANLIDDTVDQSLLNFACLLNDVETVRKLLEVGVNINQRDKNGYLLLINAISQVCFNPEIFHLLLEKANPNLENAYGATVLTVAVDQANGYILNFLLDTGKFDVNYTTSLGITALERAICNANVEIVRILLQHGAKTDFAECKRIEDSPLYHLCSNEKVAELLREYYRKAKATLVLVKNPSTFFQQMTANTICSQANANSSEQNSFSIK